MKFVAFLTLFAALSGAAASADQMPTYTGPESRLEQQFVAGIRQNLMQRFPSARDAERAGYVRYTSPDESGAISYANLHWNSADPQHPSQLWYDSKGRLLGADFSVTLARSPGRPALWGINPGRWTELDGHQHWVAKDPATGALVYEQYVHDGEFAKAGGDPEHPSASTLVAMHKVEKAGDVVTLFHFPSLWDLAVWVKPNKSGAFTSAL
jgi:hypothetical protein